MVETNYTKRDCHTKETLPANTSCVGLGSS